MFLARFSGLCFLIMQITAVPPEQCFADFRWDDCGKSPEPVMYYWKPGSRCEVGTWRGCLPNPNMFKNEYECVETCVFNVERYGRHENIDNILKQSDSLETMESDNVGLNETETNPSIDYDFNTTTVTTESTTSNDTLVSNKTDVLNDTKLVDSEAKNSDKTLASNTTSNSGETSLSNNTLGPDDKSPSNATLVTDTEASNVSSVNNESTSVSNDSLATNKSFALNENLVPDETSRNETQQADETPVSKDTVVENVPATSNETAIQKGESDETGKAEVEGDKPGGRSQLAKYLKGK